MRPRATSGRRPRIKHIPIRRSVAKPGGVRRLSKPLASRRFACSPRRRGTRADLRPANSGEVWRATPLGCAALRRMGICLHRSLRLRAHADGETRVTTDSAPTLWGGTGHHRLRARADGETRVTTDSAPTLWGGTGHHRLRARADGEARVATDSAPALWGGTGHHRLRARADGADCARIRPNLAVKLFAG